MWVAYFLNYCDRQAVFAMFPSLHADLGMSDKQLGFVGTAFLWVYGFGCPIAGQLGDRFSRRVLVALSLALWSVITIATGFAFSATMMLILRAVMGITESLYMPTAIALTANAHPPQLRSRAIATLTTAQIVGTVAGSWFGGWMADRGLWRGAFFSLGAVGVLYALPYFLFLRTVNDRPADPAPPEDLAIGELLQVPSFLLMCATFPVFVFGLWLIYGWFPTFLHNKFSLNQADAAFNATVYLQGATFIGLLAGGFLADALFHRTKAARLWLLVTSFLLCAPCLVAMGASASLAATRLSAAGFGLFAGLLQGNIFPAAFEVAPARTRSSAVGALNFFGAIVSGFATLFGGFWQASLGIDRLLSFTAVAYLIAGLLLIAGIRVFFRRDYERIHSLSP
jgi:predicted MFS family arabinose efflux permease